MKMFMALFRLHIGRQLRRLSFWVAFCLPLLLLLCLAVFSPKEQENTLIVGIWAEAESPSSQAFFEKLKAMETPPVSFVQAEHRDQMEEMVASSVWECGYILPEDFEARLERGNYQQIFTRMVSPSTKMQMLSNTSVSAAFLSFVKDDVAASYLEKNNIVSRETFFRLLENKTLSALPFSATFDIETVKGVVPQNSTTQQLEGPLRGTIAIGLFLYCILASTSVSQELRSPFSSRMAPLVGKRTLGISASLSTLLISFIMGVLMLLIVFSNTPSLFLSLKEEALALALYLLCLSTLSYALSVLSKGTHVMALLPFLLLSSMVLSPVFIDIPKYIPMLHPISLILPPTWYFRACTGEIWAIGFLLIMTVFSLVLGLFRNKQIYSNLT